MKIEKIENKTLRQKVYKILKEKMITAEILPGEQISLRDLAGRLDVSLSPVRDALLQLESERVVVIERNRSIHVNNLTAEEMDEVLRLRITLETMAAERACDVRPQKVLRVLEQMLSDMRKSMDMPKKYVKHNQRYHFTLYASAASPILFDMISGLWARVGPYIYLHVRERDDISVAMGHHEAIYDALSRQDKKKMAKAIRNDLETGASSMKRFMGALGWDYNNIRQNLMNKGEIASSSN
jgi:DNA-binding GntR family transcriptional regulator